MKSWQKGIPGKGCHKCIGAEVGTGVACSKGGKESIVDRI